VTGVMWRARIMPLRFLGILGSGATSDAVEAILYASANGVRVINISWGGDGYSQALKDAIDASSVVVACAAGNGGSDGIGDNNDSTPVYPASYTSANIISVASTNMNDSRSVFSNYGLLSVDLAAPGENIYSTVPAREVVFTDDFDDGDLNTPNWTTGGTLNSWAASNQYSYSGSYSLTDSPFANYGNNTNSWSQSPGFSLSGKTGCKLSYRMRLLTLANDRLRVEASVNQSVWTVLNSYSGTTNGSFAALAEDLSNYEGQSAVYIRFRLETDASGASSGASIDDVEVSCFTDTYDGSEYEFNQGTSMATPHVSGVAGLILARNPSLANYQAKALILNNVDPTGLLAARVLTGGRLNAFDAVSNALAPETPTDLTVAGISNTNIDLVWTDNSSNEDGFKIERKTDENSEFTELASVSENITAYSDSNITHSTTYYYRVRAFGGSLGGFEHSNEVNATTPTPVSTSSGGDGGGGGGGCFIATAAFGSPLHPNVKELRLFRDRHLLTNSAGRAFVNFYYKYSPSLAEIIRGNNYLRFAVRIMLAPLIITVTYPYLALAALAGLASLLILIAGKRKGN
jgi:subtilisin family serine protease